MEFINLEANRAQSTRLNCNKSTGQSRLEIKVVREWRAVSKQQEILCSHAHTLFLLHVNRVSIEGNTNFIARVNQWHWNRVHIQRMDFVLWRHSPSFSSAMPWRKHRKLVCDFPLDFIQHFVHYTARSHRFIEWTRTVLTTMHTNYCINQSVLGVYVFFSSPDQSACHLFLHGK